MQPIKLEVYETCLRLLQSRKESLYAELELLKESAAADTKSSMGDKYETGREMINLEKAKVSEQLIQVQKMLDTLGAIDKEKTCKRVEVGALITTDQAIYYLAFGLGPINIMEDQVFVISAASPVGRIMLGKGVGDRFEMAGKLQEIRSLS